jgi:hypothetical protein
VGRGSAALGPDSEPKSELELELKTFSSVAVISFDEAEGRESPAALVATTVNVYAVPMVRPETVAEVVLPSAVVTLYPPGEDVTV